jgi:hypothetical protein
MHIRNETLKTIVDCLNRAGWNYTVSMQSYHTLRGEDASSSDLVRAALNNRRATIDEVQPATEAEVISEVCRSLTYAGDRSAGPDPSALQGREFIDALAGLTSEIIATAQDSNTIERFKIPEGHPFYPVFWDFAFLFTNATQATALIGSSSD